MVLRALGGRAGTVGGRTKLISTYFDTSDHALARHGFSLRVREKNGAFIQTVKSANAGATDPLRRGEWEDPIGTARPDPQAPETGRFLDRDIAGRLLPLFSTEIDRRTIELSPAQDTQIEAAIDRGRVVAPARDKSEPICEIELELKRGAPAALYDVALDLLALAPLRFEHRSKAERGYRLLNGSADNTAVSAVHGIAFEVDATLDADEALRGFGLACLEQIVRNEAAVLAELPEGIHQMRVAVRRLRAVLSAFGRLLPDEPRRAVSEERRWLADQLGPARNLDVFETTLLTPPNGEAAAEGIAALAQAAEHRRRAAYARAGRAIRSRRYTLLLLRQMRWFDGRLWRSGEPADGLQQPIAVVAGRVLDRRRRVAKRRIKGFARQSARQRHRLRIALKKLRYAAEMLAPLYDSGNAERFIKRLKRLQDELGEANDVRVGRTIVASLARRSDSGSAIAQAGKAVLDRHEQRLVKHEPRLREQLDRLFAAAPFWAASA